MNYELMILRRVQYNARKPAALNCPQMMRCASTTLPDPSSFTPAFLFSTIATISRLLWLSLNYVTKSSSWPDLFRGNSVTDVSRFEKTGIFTIQDYHSWAVENPHLVRVSNFQQRFSVRIWSGILSGELIGPFGLPSRLNGHACLEFLQKNLPESFGGVNMETKCNMIFQNYVTCLEKWRFVPLYEASKAAFEQHLPKQMDRP
ncbi:hypothetical protein EVAR_67932_1 [Eumeta japonica]|uniref:Uncharacterized protein n=1 Tax=Eumeta variegata TaxID=151549 RepID=A0A4C1ZKV3_EUMVA|nr:hypothetical protein EVAR_67932_1 [Eumeta japonica]